MRQKSNILLILSLLLVLIGGSNVAYSAQHYHFTNQTTPPITDPIEEPDPEPIENPEEPIDDPEEPKEPEEPEEPEKPEVPEEPEEENPDEENPPKEKPDPVVEPPTDTNTTPSQPQTENQSSQEQTSNNETPEEELESEVMEKQEPKVKELVSFFDEHQSIPTMDSYIFENVMTILLENKRSTELAKGMKTAPSELEKKLSITQINQMLSFFENVASEQWDCEKIVSDIKELKESKQ
ncbi:hypothetical protein FIU87_18740 [Bacillus sp. THAF10]|uniref:hypothetical protein n=1 Tax=Bacillus sp. THAF10 TaxID=2587848 RepID=UPI0012AA1D4D|nr:hypothetical protein [Bacillus sp. THAF10]QFT90686.1 hypothetical protein FIU87_18740 [Bacillus sp. THAF10]